MMVIDKEEEDGEEEPEGEEELPLKLLQLSTSARYNCLEKAIETGQPISLGY